MAYQEPKFLIYGANGYTGRLIAELAITKGHRPLLAGRSEDKLKRLAKELDLSYKVCKLDDSDQLSDLVLGVDVVVHCAGPFIHTAKAMAEACLKNRTHYIDITGEIDVFEYMKTLDDDAKAARIMLLPGAGFDVVPTDCLAAHLKERMPNAQKLILAFMGMGGGISRGTAKTMLENIDKGGAIRHKSRIKKVEIAHKAIKITFNNRPQLCISIPWGDVSTAYHSTGIPNIEVYTSISNTGLTILRAGQKLGRFLGNRFIKEFLMKQADARLSGPTAKQRKAGKSYIWGQVINEDGKTRQTGLVTPEGYQLTAMTAISIVEKILAGNFKTGFMTPSLAYGKDFIMDFKSVERIDY